MQMYEYCGRFQFSADMNGDLAFTISDVWEMAKLAWLLPSNALTALLHESDRLASFFEIGCATGQGLGGGLFSLLCWLFLAAALGVMSQ